MEGFHDRLKKALDFKGIKAVDFAVAIGRSEPSVSQYLSGASTPQFAVLMKMKESLEGINFHWLLFGEGSMTQNPPNMHYIDIAPKKETPSSTNVGEGGALAMIEARLAALEQAIAVGKCSVVSYGAIAA